MTVSRNKKGKGVEDRDKRKQKQEDRNKAKDFSTLPGQKAPRTRRSRERKGKNFKLLMTDDK